MYGFVLAAVDSQAERADGHDRAGWLSALPYLAAVIAMLVVSWGSDKMPRKRFVWPPLLIASIAFYASYMLGAEHFW